MKTIVYDIDNKDGIVNIEQIIDKHFETIQVYGNSQGWPVEIGLVKNKNTFVLADIKNDNEKTIICRGTIHKNYDKASVVNNMVNSINFMI